MKWQRARDFLESKPGTTLGPSFCAAWDAAEIQLLMGSVAPTAPGGGIHGRIHR